MLTLTPAGADLVEQAIAFRLDLLRELTAGWSAADRARLGDLMTRSARAVSGARS